MAGSIDVFDVKVKVSFIRTLPWLSITVVSVGLYLLERKRVDDMIKLNSDREKKTSDYNAWLKEEINRFENEKLEIES